MDWTKPRYRCKFEDEFLVGNSDHIYFRVRLTNSEHNVYIQSQSLLENNASMVDTAVDDFLHAHQGNLIISTFYSIFSIHNEEMRIQDEPIYIAHLACDLPTRLTHVALTFVNFMEVPKTPCCDIRRRRFCPVVQLYARLSNRRHPLHTLTRKAKLLIFNEYIKQTCANVVITLTDITLYEFATLKTNLSRGSHDL
jgi:hypothetical protein